MANIIVLFEVKPTKTGMKKYLDLAAMPKPMLYTDTDRAQAPQDSNRYFGREG